MGPGIRSCGRSAVGAGESVQRGEAGREGWHAGKAVAGPWERAGRVQGQGGRRAGCECMGRASCHHAHAAPQSRTRLACCQALRSTALPAWPRLLRSLTPTPPLPSSLPVTALSSGACCAWGLRHNTARPPHPQVPAHAVHHGEQRRAAADGGARLQRRRGSGGRPPETARARGDVRHGHWRGHCR